jgi:hypothetical protein
MCPSEAILGAATSLKSIRISQLNKAGDDEGSSGGQDVK